MITNSPITIYHCSLDQNTHNEVWTRVNYDNAWWFGGKGSRFNKGYDNANNVEVRIPYDKNEVDLTEIAIGDIIVKGKLESDITTQQDLENEIIYNITSINDNSFGNNPHLHLGGV